MAYRELINEVTPPIALRIARRVWRRWRGLGWHVFYGAWPSLDDVPVTSGDPWAATLLDKLATPSSAPLALSGLILPLVASCQGRPVTVLDFGGGSAAGLANMLRYAPVALSRYVLVETPAMAAALRPMIAARADHTVSDQIPEQLPHPLIVNATTSIQYIRDWKSSLAKLARLKPEFFTVTYLTLTEGPTYARQVLETPHRKVGQWVFNRDEFLEQMRVLGYQPVFSADHDVAIDQGKAPGPSIIAGLIFAPDN
jgi:putative methyltransferase (TIGR04325 family)